MNSGYCSGSGHHQNQFIRLCSARKGKHEPQRGGAGAACDCLPADRRRLMPGGWGGSRRWSGPGTGCFCLSVAAGGGRGKELQTDILNYALNSAQQNPPIFLREMTESRFCRAFLKCFFIIIIVIFYFLHLNSDFKCAPMKCSCFHLHKSQFKLFGNYRNTENKISIRKVNFDFKKQLVGAETNRLFLLFLPWMTVSSQPEQLTFCLSVWQFVFLSPFSNFNVVFLGPNCCLVLHQKWPRNLN